MPTVTDLQSWANDPPSARRHLSELLGLLVNPDDERHAWAQEALENCGPPNPEQVPWLVTQLQSSHSDTQYWAATLLGRAGAAARTATSALQTTIATGKASAAVMQRVAWALAEIESTSTASR